MRGSTASVSAASLNDTCGTCWTMVTPSPPAGRRQRGVGDSSPRVMVALMLFCVTTRGLRRTCTLPSVSSADSAASMLKAPLQRSPALILRAKLSVARVGPAGVPPARMPSSGRRTAWCCRAPARPRRRSPTGCRARLAKSLVVGRCALRSRPAAAARRASPSSACARSMPAGRSVMISVLVRGST